MLGPVRGMCSKPASGPAKAGERAPGPGAGGRMFNPHGAGGIVNEGGGSVNRLRGQALRATRRKCVRQDLGNLSGGENRRPVLSKALPDAGTGTASSGRLSRTEGQAMPIRWRTREYERTCDDCGHVWRVPRWAAPPLHVRGRPVSEGCEGGVPPPAAAVIADPAVAATAQLAERAAAFFRRCRECGSQHYKQRFIWSWTDDPAC